MTRSWRCPPGSLAAVLDQVGRVGASVAGSPAEGTLSAPTPLGRIEGRYRYDGDLLTVTLTKTPPLLPVEAVWSRLDGILGPPVAMA